MPELAELEREEFYCRATELAAVAAWSRGETDRSGFRRWLRSEGWTADDVDVFTAAMEYVFAGAGRAAGSRARGAA